jgi:hypothetical protein
MTVDRTPEALSIVVDKWLDAEAKVAALKESLRCAELLNEHHVKVFAAQNSCWKCHASLEPAGSPESLVPRCEDCPEPESMDEVDNGD